MMYIALIGDIIESKKIQDRAQVQQQLLRLMKELNWQYQDYLISPFLINTVKCHTFTDFRINYPLISILY